LYLVLIVSVDIAPLVELVTVLGVNLAVAPFGSPATVKPTDPATPFVSVTVTVSVVLEPRLTLGLEVEAPTEKSGAGGGVTVKVPEVAVPAVVVTVIEPVVAPEGTLVVIEVPVGSTVKLALVPWNFTEPAPAKF
jgi:hypothetical protein